MGEARISGIFLLQFAALTLLRNAIGNHLHEYCCFLVKSHSCDDNMVCFSYLIALSIGGTLLALLLLIRPSRRSTIWSFATALIVLDIVTATHMRGPGCM